MVIVSTRTITSIATILLRAIAGSGENTNQRTLQLLALHIRLCVLLKAAVNCGSLAVNSLVILRSTISAISGASM